MYKHNKLNPKLRGYIFLMIIVLGAFYHKLNFQFQTRNIKHQHQHRKLVFGVVYTLSNFENNFIKNMLNDYFI